MEPASPATAPAANEGKGLVWTDEAKYQLLLRIVAQLREDGKPINWQTVNMAGRTTKSLQNIWTKINKEIAEIKGNDGQAVSGEAGPAGPVTPAKTPTKGRRGRPKKVEKSEAIVHDDDTEPEVVTPKKRGAAAKSPPGSAKKAKKEEVDVATAAYPLSPEESGEI